MVFYYYRLVSPISNSGTSSVVWLWLCFLYPDWPATDRPTDLTDRLTDGLTVCHLLFQHCSSFLDSLNCRDEDLRIAGE